MNILTKYTLKTLKENKSRTVVTITGIALSVCMLVAVTLLVNSCQGFLQKSVIRAYGDWHGAVLNSDGNVLRDMQENSDIDRLYVFEDIGFSLPAGGIESGPYLYFMGTDPENLDEMALDYIQDTGRLPENENEILLPDSYTNYNWEKPLQPGDSFTVSVGRRMLNGEKLTRYNPYIEGETFEICEERTFTVTGFYRRNAMMESGAMHGFAAITGGTTGEYPMDIYFHRKDLNNVYTIMDRYTGAPYNRGSITNTTLIRFSATTIGSGYNPLLYGMQGVLYAIIIFASISLIYNAFAISVGERIRRFGLLSSIGATAKQLTKTVLTEAAMLSVIGVPLGILRGIVGIGVTLKLSRGLLALGFESIVFAGAENVSFEMVIKPLPIMASALLGFVTVLISAYIPVRKAMKQSAIDSIRGATRIMPEKHNIKILPFVQKISGFEGTMAIKNFKRSKTRYRATVFSLFTSIVLFIAAYTFCNDLERSVERNFGDNFYDLEYSYHVGFDMKDQIIWPDDVLAVIREIPEVTQAVYTACTRTECYTSWESITGFEHFAENLQGEMSESAEEAVQNEKQPENAKLLPMLFYLNDSDYDKWLEENNLEKYTDDGRFIGYTNTVYNGKNIVQPGQTIDFTYGEDSEKRFKFAVRYRDDIPHLPFEQHSGILYVFLPYKVYNMKWGDFVSSNICINCKNPMETEEKIVNILRAKGIDKNLIVQNYYKDMRTLQAIAGIAKLFSFGFITLISLIAAANAFNTVSTNISLRRRELAVFTSAGMTDRQMRKMLASECAVCGLRATIPGIPAGIAASVLVWKSSMWGVDYMLPADSLWISVVMVCAVMFATMIYTLKKISRQNIIETLKNENA